ncbi:MAG: hypothetical protein Q9211_000059 [Gyalolechia sp. 1 TL-2023]
MSGFSRFLRGGQPGIATSDTAARALRYRRAFTDLATAEVRTLVLPLPSPLLSFLQGLHFIKQIPREQVPQATIEILDEMLQHLKGNSSAAGKISPRPEVTHGREGLPRQEVTVLSDDDTPIGYASTGAQVPVCLSSDEEPIRPQLIPRTGPGARHSRRRKQRVSHDSMDLSGDASLPAVVPKKRSVGRPRKSGSSPAAQTSPSIYSVPYGALLVIDEFHLDKTFQDHLDANPFLDPIAFLGDSLPAVVEGFPSLETFPAFCYAVDQMPKADLIASVRRFFMLLTVWRIAFKFSPSLQGLQAGVARFHSRDTYRSLEDTVKLAKRVFIVHERFSNGSFFWLAHELTDQFLRHKVSGSGRHLTNAVEHLTRLGVLNSIKESPATRLGDAVENHLGQIYRVSEAMPVVTELE